MLSKEFLKKFRPTKHLSVQSQLETLKKEEIVSNSMTKIPPERRVEFFLISLQLILNIFHTFF